MGICNFVTNTVVTNTVCFQPFRFQEEENLGLAEAFRHGALHKSTNLVFIGKINSTLLCMYIVAPASDLGSIVTLK